MSTKSGTDTLESMSQAVWYNRWTLRKFENYLKGDILEVGCGIGNFTKELIKFGKVFAVDIDKQHVKQTASLLDGKVAVNLGDIEKEKNFFDGKKFDSIVCINVLEHIENDELALNNIYSLLKNNGYLILLVPSHQFLYGAIDKSIGHYRRYDKKKLEIILKKTGFEIEKLRILNIIGAIGWFVSSKIFSEKIVDERKIKLFNLIAPLILSLEDIVEPPFGTSILVVAKRQ